jgi:similar to spore coat protein
MNYALHEVLEVQEMAAFKTNCLTKSKTMRAMVSDPRLKEIMLQDINLSTRQLNEYTSVLSNAKQSLGVE